MLKGIENCQQTSRSHPHLHFGYRGINEKKYAWLHTIMFADRFCLSSSQHHPNTNPPVCHRTPRCVWTVISGGSLTITGCDCVPSSSRQHGCRASCAGKPGANDLAWSRKTCCAASKSPRRYWWDDKTLKHHGSGYVFYCTAAYCPRRKTPGAYAWTVSSTTVVLN